MAAKQSSRQTGSRRTVARRSATAKRRPSAKRRTAHTTQRWSQRVTQRSDALDLSERVFTRDDPASIARSLKRSAQVSHRRKSDPYRSAMSMLSFYLNRAGKTLPATRRRKLERAKDELRKLFGRQ